MREKFKKIWKILTIIGTITSTVILLLVLYCLIGWAIQPKNMFDHCLELEYKKIVDLTTADQNYINACKVEGYISK